VPDLENRKDVERWLKGKPGEVALVIAARSALRVAPLLATALGPRGGLKKASRDIFLPAFRGMAAPWVAGTWPARSGELRDAADAAAAAAADVWAALSADVSALDARPPLGMRATDLAIQPVWATGIPDWARTAWERLERLSNNGCAPSLRAAD
jgi:hypothetical protein